MAQQRGARDLHADHVASRAELTQEMLFSGVERSDSFSQAESAARQTVRAEPRASEADGTHQENAVWWCGAKRQKQTKKTIRQLGWPFSFKGE